MQITRVDCPLDKFDMACKLLELRTFPFSIENLLLPGMVLLMDATSPEKWSLKRQVSKSENLFLELRRWRGYTHRAPVGALLTVEAAPSQFYRKRRLTGEQAASRWRLCSVEASVQRCLGEISRTGERVALRSKFGQEKERQGTDGWWPPSEGQVGRPHTAT